jgi:5-hydroxyisourate hydrolase-like protein (transthyretin family)
MKAHAILFTLITLVIILLIGSFESSAIGSTVVTGEISTVNGSKAYIQNQAFEIEGKLLDSTGSNVQPIGFMAFHELRSIDRLGNAAFTDKVKSSEVDITFTASANQLINGLFVPMYPLNDETETLRSYRFTWNLQNNDGTSLMSGSMIGNIAQGQILSTGGIYLLSGERHTMNENFVLEHTDVQLVSGNTYTIELSINTAYLNDQDEGLTFPVSTQSSVQLSDSIGSHGFAIKLLRGEVIGEFNFNTANAPSSYISEHTIVAVNEYILLMTYYDEFFYTPVSHSMIISITSSVTHAPQILSVSDQSIEYAVQAQYNPLVQSNSDPVAGAEVQLYIYHNGFWHLKQTATTNTEGLASLSFSAIYDIGIYAIKFETTVNSIKTSKLVELTITKATVEFENITSIGKYGSGSSSNGSTIVSVEGTLRTQSGKLIHGIEVSVSDSTGILSTSNTVNGQFSINFEVDLLIGLHSDQFFISADSVNIHSIINQSLTVVIEKGEYNIYIGGHVFFYDQQENRSVSGLVKNKGGFGLQPELSIEYFNQDYWQTVSSSYIVGLDGIFTIEINDGFEKLDVGQYHNFRIVALESNEYNIKFANFEITITKSTLSFDRSGIMVSNELRLSDMDAGLQYNIPALSGDASRTSDDCNGLEICWPVIYYQTSIDVSFYILNENNLGVPDASVKYYVLDQSVDQWVLVGQAITNQEGLSYFMYSPSVELSNLSADSNYMRLDVTHSNYEANSYYFNFFEIAVPTYVSDIEILGSDGSVVYNTEYNIVFGLYDLFNRTLNYDNPLIEVTFNNSDVKQIYTSGEFILSHKFSSVGSYSIEVNYYPMDNIRYRSISREFIIDVEKAEYIVIKSDHKMSQNETITVPLTVFDNQMNPMQGVSVKLYALLPDSTVTIGVNAITDSQGKLEYTFRFNQPVGFYEFEWYIEGNQNFHTKQVRFIIHVDTILTYIESNQSTISYQFAAINPSIELMLRGADNLKLTNKALDYRILSENGSEILYSGSNLLTDSNGKLVIELPKFISPGTYIFEVLFSGSGIYVESNRSIPMEITGSPTKIEFLNQPNSLVYYGDELYLNFKVLDDLDQKLVNAEVRIYINSIRVATLLSSSEGIIEYSQILKEETLTAEVKIRVMSYLGYEESFTEIVVDNEKKQLEVSPVNETINNGKLHSEYSDSISANFTIGSNVEIYVSGIKIEVRQYHSIDSETYVVIYEYFTINGTVFFEFDLLGVSAGQSIKIEIYVYDENEIYVPTNFNHTILITKKSVQGSFNLVNPLIYLIDGKLIFVVVDNNGNHIEGLLIDMSWTAVDAIDNGIFFLNVATDSNGQVSTIILPLYMQYQITYFIKDPNSNYSDRHGTVVLQINKSDALVQYNLATIHNTPYIEIFLENSLGTKLANIPIVVSYYDQTTDQWISYDAQYTDSLGYVSFDIANQNSIDQVYRIEIANNSKINSQQLEINAEMEEIVMSTFNTTILYNSIFTPGLLISQSTSTLVIDVYYLIDDHSILLGTIVYDRDTGLFISDIILNHELLPGFGIYEIKYVVPQQGFIFENVEYGYIVYQQNQLQINVNSLDNLDDLDELQVSKNKSSTLEISLVDTNNQSIDYRSVVVEIYLYGEWTEIVAVTTNEFGTGLLVISLDESIPNGLFNARLFAPGDDNYYSYEILFTIKVVEPTILILEEYNNPTIVYSEGISLKIRLLDSSGQPLSNKDIQIKIFDSSTGTYYDEYYLLQTDSNGMVEFQKLFQYTDHSLLLSELHIIYEGDGFLSNHLLSLEYGYDYTLARKAVQIRLFEDEFYGITANQTFLVGIVDQSNQSVLDETIVIKWNLQKRIDGIYEYHSSGTLYLTIDQYLLLVEQPVGLFRLTIFIENHNNYLSGTANQLQFEFENKKIDGSNISIELADNQFSYNKSNNTLAATLSYDTYKLSNVDLEIDTPWGRISGQTDYHGQLIIVLNQSLNAGEFKLILKFENSKFFSQVFDLEISILIEKATVPLEVDLIDSFYVDENLTISISDPLFQSTALYQIQLFAELNSSVLVYEAHNLTISELSDPIPYDYFLPGTYRIVIYRYAENYHNQSAEVEFIVKRIPVEIYEDTYIEDDYIIIDLIFVDKRSNQILYDVNYKVVITDEKDLSISEELNLNTFEFPVSDRSSYYISIHTLDRYEGSIEYIFEIPLDESIISSAHPDLPNQDGMSIDYEIVTVSLVCITGVSYIVVKKKLWVFKSTSP